MIRTEYLRRGRKAASAMPLDYAEFAHHYEASGLSDAQTRAHFDVFAGIMECLVRQFWREAHHGGGSDNPLGIMFDSDILALVEEVKSKNSQHIKFNKVAAGSAP